MGTPPLLTPSPPNNAGEAQKFARETTVLSLNTPYYTHHQMFFFIIASFKKNQTNKLGFIASGLVLWCTVHMFRREPKKNPKQLQGGQSEGGRNTWPGSWHSHAKHLWGFGPLWRQKVGNLPQGFWKVEQTKETQDRKRHFWVKCFHPAMDRKKNPNPNL